MSALLTSGPLLMRILSLILAIWGGYNTAITALNASTEIKVVQSSDGSTKQESRSTIPATDAVASALPLLGAIGAFAASFLTKLKGSGGALPWLEVVQNLLADPNAARRTQGAMTHQILLADGTAIKVTAEIVPPTTAPASAPTFPAFST